MNESIKQTYKEFLEDFCQIHYGEVTDDGPLPMRFLTTTVTVKEVEAEVIDWVLQYLTTKCPRLLGAHIARRVADHIFSLDYGDFVDEGEEDKDTKKVEASEATAVSLQNRQKEQEEGGLSKDSVLSIDALAAEVFTKVHSLCAEWNKSLPTEVLPGESSSLIHQVSAHAIKNTRRKMEDKHAILPNLKQLYNMKTNMDPIYIGVFDGHAGPHGSNYAAAHFHDNLVKHPKFDSDIVLALKETFLVTDNDFCAKAERESLGSGSTGVCAFLTDSSLHVGWLGDSEALLVKDGRPITVVVPHKPSRQDEQKRIQALGGFVECRNDVYRVNGIISVARAIGDRNLKPFLCAEADVVSVPLDGSEDYVVLGCDGLWDVVTYDEVVEHVYSHVEETDGDRSGVAQMLVRLAKEQGSDDNITVVVVFLREKVSPPNTAAAGVTNVTVDKKDSSTDGEKKDGGAEKDDSGSSDKSSGHKGAMPSAGDSRDVSSGHQGSSQTDKDSKNRSNSLQSALTGKNSKGSNGSDSKSSFEPNQKLAGSGTVQSLEMQQDDTSPGSKNKPSSDQVVIKEPPKQEQTVSTLKQLSIKISPPDSTCIGHIEIVTQEKSSNPSQISIPKMKSLRPYEAQSTGSGKSELVLLTEAAKYVGNRRTRRGRNGRKKNSRDSRRASRESQNSGVAHRTNGTSSRIRSSSESKVPSFPRTRQEVPISPSGGENMFRMLMGCNPNVIHRSKSQNRWTVAVEMEIESASAMFDDVTPERLVPARRRSHQK